MFNNKRTSFFILLMLGTLFTQSCDKCCKDGLKALPDLIQQGVDITNNLSNGEFEVGDIGEIATFCINAADAFSECGTSAADQNEHKLGLYYRADSTGAFTRVGDANYLMAKLGSNEIFEDNQEVTFNIPGQYYIGDSADIKDVVVERLETNNSEETENIKTRSSTESRSASFIVRSNPEIEQRLAAGEQIPFFIFHDKPNLLEYSMKIANGDWIHLKIR